MSDWTDSLQQASFRGIPFAVLGGDGRHGRRLGVHQYPYRDKPWAEDLGRGVRRYTVTGFLISDSAVYGGGDVISQREKLIGAAEAEGSGTLVHPTLGELTVSIPEDGFSWQERWDTGRYFEITLLCIESGDREFPSASNDTGGDTNSAADGMDQAAATSYATQTTGNADFFTGISDALHEGASVVGMVTRTAQSWTALLMGAASDATGLFNMLVELPGNFGRYFAGRTVGFASGNVLASSQTVDSLINTGIAERSVVGVACAALVSAAQGVDPNATAVAAQAAAAALFSAMANPSDGIRIFSGLFNFYPALPVPNSLSGQAEQIVQVATGSLFRRSILGALARTTAVYQPSSADDAANLKANVAALFDAEIETAGDDGDDTSYEALRTCRAAIILDLNTRGASLPQLQTVISAEPVSALVIAQRLYQDEGRADELITEADPVHPLFMPTTFKALVV